MHTIKYIFIRRRIVILKYRNNKNSDILFGEDIEINLSLIASDFVTKPKNSKIEEKFSISWNEIIWNIVLIIMASVGSLYAYLSVIDFEVNNAVIVTAIICFAIFSTLQICLMGRIETIFLTFIIFDILLFLKRNIIMNGLCNFIDEFILKFNDYYGNILPMLQPEKISVNDNTVFLLFAMFIVVYITSIMIIFRRTWLLGFGFLLSISFPLTVGFVPDIKFLILMFICLIVNVIVNIGHRKKGNICVRLRSKIIKSYNLVGISTVIVMTILTILISNVLVPRMTNVFESTTKTLSKIKSNSFFSGISMRDLPEHLPGLLENMLLYSNTSYTGVSGGRLGRGKVIFNKGQVDLNIKFDNKLENPWYFKSYVGIVYKNTRWDEVDEDVADAYLSWNHDTSAFNLPYIILDSLKAQSDNLAEPFSENGVYVSMKKANSNYLYWPYLGSKNEQEEVQLAFLRPDGSDDYFQFYQAENLIDAATTIGSYVTGYNVQTGIRQDKVTNVSWTDMYYSDYDYTVLGSMEKYLELEEEYRQKVYTVCLQVPSKGMDRLKKLVDEEFVSKNGQRNIEDINLLEKIIFVQDYLKDAAVYDISPGMTPISEDFVDYFLFENKKGYCMHFASAATLMFRILGVPARFVEGYVVHATDANTDVEVKDQSAHAWTEIYIDGFGWIPIETTPGYNQESLSYEDVKDVIDDKSDIVDLESMPVDETQEVESGTDLQQTKSENDDKSSSRKNISKDNANSNKNQSIFYQIMNNKWMKATLNIIKIVVVIFLIKLVIIERRKLVLKFRKEKFRTGNNKKTVKIIFNMIGKIVKSVNGDNIDLFNVQKMTQMCSYLNQSEYSEFIDIVNKTLFSEHNIQTLERKRVEEMYKQMVTNIYLSLKRPQQFIFKYIYCYI